MGGYGLDLGWNLSAIHQDTAAIACLILPSIIVSLGIALEFQIVDQNVKAIGDAYQVNAIQSSYRTAMGLLSSGLGAHLT